MLALFLPLIIMCLYCLIRRRTGRANSLVFAILIFSCMIWGITEILSNFKLLSRGSVLICWTFLAILCLGFNLILRNRVLFEDVRYCYAIYCGLQKYEKVIVLIVVAIYAGFSLLCPFIVNLNSDSLAYHLPRVMMWIQNHSVDYYVTGYPAQNYVPPFPDYIQMHLMLLSGWDRFQGIIQITSSALCLIILMKLTYEVTHSRSALPVAAVLYMSIPIIIRETNTTQSDLVASMYLLCLAYLIYVASKETVLSIMDKSSLIYMFMAGMALSLLYVSKSSLAFSAIVIIIWFGIKRLMKKDRVIDLVMLAVLAAVPFIVMILPMFFRNLSIGETALAGNYFSIHLTGNLLPQYLCLNAYKNWAELAATPITADTFLAVGTIIGGVFGGIDINAEEIKSSAVPFMSNIKWYMDEDLSGAPYFMIFASISFILMLICLFKGSKEGKTVINIDFLLVLFFQFIPLAMMTRWQPYGTRYMMPSLILTIVPTAYMLTYFFDKRVLAVILTIGFLISIPCYFMGLKGAWRIISGKAAYDNYYAEVTGLTGIPATEEYIENNNCSNIGFYGYHCFAYPQFKVFMKPGRRVEYTIPEEPVPEFVPDVIYSYGVKPYSEREIIIYNGERYVCSKIYNGEEALYERID